MSSCRRGQVCAHDKVHLSAGTGDMTDAGGFCGDLAIQVDVDGAVDGDEVADGGDGVNAVHIVHGSAHALGVVVDKVIQLLGAGAEGVDLTAGVQFLVLTADLAGHGQVDEGVNIHLGVNAQVLQIGLGDDAADGVGHAAMPSCRQAWSGIRGTT